MTHPFQKSTSEGRLYLDTTDPSFESWILDQIKNRRDLKHKANEKRNSSKN